MSSGTVARGRHSVNPSRHTSEYSLTAPASTLCAISSSLIGPIGTSLTETCHWAMSCLLAGAGPYQRSTARGRAALAQDADRRARCSQPLATRTRVVQPRKDGAVAPMSAGGEPVMPTAAGSRLQPRAQAVQAPIAGSHPQTRTRRSRGRSPPLAGRRSRSGGRTYDRETSRPVQRPSRRQPCT